MKKNRLLALTLIALLTFVLAACATPATDEVVEPVTEEEVVEEEPAEEEPAEEEPAEEEPAEEEPADDEEAAADSDVVTITWYVGLGAGSDEPTFEPQQEVVDRFNETHDDIELVINIVDNDTAFDTLATQIAGGNAPDLVGPVGIRGRDTFKGAWLDLNPLIEANDYDLSDFDPAMVDFYQVQEEGQLGIPFAIYPSFIIYNQDLFDEAGLPYPPTEHGAPYVDADGNELDWDMNTLRDLSMQLTVDNSGFDATEGEFDSESIVQFGFQNQWTDPRGIGTFFGPGTLVSESGAEAQIPADWVDAWEWTYDGWWEDYFIPNGPYGGAEFLQGPGGPFSSGNMGMIHMHLWYVAPWALGDVDFAWGLAATPSYDGEITAKMHADTFGIMKSTEHPEETFEVLTFLLSEEVSNDLLNIYGGMPARLSQQETWLAEYFVDNFPDQDVQTDVIIEAMSYADNPNHESWMPSFLEAENAYNEFWNKLSNEPGLDFEAEVEALEDNLNEIFQSAEAQ